MKLYAIKEACQRTGIPQSHLSTAVQQGLVRTEVRFLHRPGKSKNVPSYLIPEKDLDAFAERYFERKGKITAPFAEKRVHYSRNEDALKRGETRRAIEKKLDELAEEREMREFL